MFLRKFPKENKNNNKIKNKVTFRLHGTPISFNQLSQILFFMWIHYIYCIKFTLHCSTLNNNTSSAIASKSEHF